MLWCLMCLPQLFYLPKPQMLATSELMSGILQPAIPRVVWLIADINGSFGTGGSGKIMVLKAAATIESYVLLSQGP